ncbi:MAG TPA: DinB family protein [Pyrinomonadaceae bacterium]
MTFKRTTLAPASGFSTGVGYYMSALDEIREQLRETVAGLSDEQLAARVVPGAHSIGALVLHVGESEWWWTRCVIGGHAMTDEDRQQPFWDVLLRPEEFAQKGYSAAFCLEAIDEIRAGTRDSLSSFTDEDLDRIYSHALDGRTLDVSLRWTLHHLADHEAQHKGQILLLKRLLDAHGGR